MRARKAVEREAVAEDMGKVEFGQSSPGEYIKREEGREVGERWLGIGSGVYGATLLVSINFFPSSPFYFHPGGQALLWRAMYSTF